MYTLVKSTIGITVLFLGIANTTASFELDPFDDAEKIAAMRYMETKAKDNRDIKFFHALMTCEPGEYSFTNNIAKYMGPKTLHYEIDGMEQHFCKVKLQTPQNKLLHCLLLPSDVNILYHSEFIDGISYHSKKPDLPPIAISAEKTWSDIQFSYCGFGDYYQTIIEPAI